jgi:protein involved in polysaccharide export with SLBB domain
MIQGRFRLFALLLTALSFGLMAMTGCRPFDHYDHTLDVPVAMPAVPRELSKMSLPAYRIEPPDVLQLEVQKLVPLPPYHIETFDMLQISAVGTLPDQPPINSYYLVDGEGRVNLGPGYGSVRVAGMTVDEANRAIDAHLREILKFPEVSVQLARPSGVQAVNGNYLVAADGSVNLRQYGTVAVAGCSISEARIAIQKQLQKFFDSPIVSLDVIAYNSKVFYIITEGAGQGDNLVRIPITGNETVLDAMANVHGLSQLSSKKIWVARPAPAGFHCEQILPVDWDAITRGGATATNYQLLPGDRLFIAQDDMLALTNYIGKVVGPVERVLGVGTLGASTVRNFQTLGRQFNKNQNAGRGF